MARSPITETSETIGSDSGNILWSFIQGEQLVSQVTISNLQELNGYELEAVVMEALNVEGNPSVPTEIPENGVSTVLATSVEDNIITLKFPKTLSLDWAVKPTPVSAVYGYFELRVTEPITAAFPQTFKLVRGVVELLFSPTELTP